MTTPDDDEQPHDDESSKVNDGPVLDDVPVNENGAPEMAPVVVTFSVGDFVGE